MDLETLNVTLFQWLGAGYAPEPHLLAVARWIAVYSLASVPLLLLLLWWRRPRNRETILTAVASGGFALAATELLAAITAHPRPFMVGLSPLYVAHAAEGSFPSAHASLMLAVAGTLMITRGTSVWGAGLAVFGLATAWARVYLGLHFPLDILGSALMAAATVAALGRCAHGWAESPRKFLERLGSQRLGRNSSGDTGNSGSKVD